MKKPMIIMLISLVMSLFTLNFPMIIIFPMLCFIPDNLIKLFVKNPNTVRIYQKFARGMGWNAEKYMKFLIAAPKNMLVFAFFMSSIGIDFYFFPIYVGIVLLIIDIITGYLIIHACVLLYRYELNIYRIVTFCLKE